MRCADNCGLDLDQGMCSFDIWKKGTHIAKLKMKKSKHTPVSYHCNPSVLSCFLHGRNHFPKLLFYFHVIILYFIWSIGERQTPGTGERSWLTKKIMIEFSLQIHSVTWWKLLVFQIDAHNKKRVSQMSWRRPDVLACAVFAFRALRGLACWNTRRRTWKTAHLANCCEQMRFVIRQNFEADEMTQSIFPGSITPPAHCLIYLEIISF